MDLRSNWIRRRDRHTRVVSALGSALGRYGLYVLAVLILVLVSGLSVYAVVAALSAPRPPSPAPFRYSQAAYDAEQALICPGDVLRWQVESIVEEAPVTVISSRSVWSVSAGRTVVPARTGDRTEVTWPYMTTISATTAYTVPLGLPQGVYFLMVSTARREGSRSAIYHVPFAIKPARECPGGQ